MTNSSLGCEGSSTRTPCGGAHRRHCLGELLEQVQPRLTRAIPGSVVTYTVTPPSSRWVDLTSVTVVVSPGAACGERGLDDGRPGVAAPFPSSSEFYRHSAGCWAQ